MSVNTHKTYNAGLASFRSFRNSSGHNDVWPPTLLQLIEYVAYLSQKNYAYTTVNCHIAAISYKNKINNLKDETQHFLVRRLLEGLHRLKGTKDIRLPVTSNMLEQILSSLIHVCVSDYEKKLFSSAFSLAFCALLRVSELAVYNSKATDGVIALDDVIANKNMVSLHIRMSKTDQRGRGARIPIPITKSNTFLYFNLRQYLMVRPNVPGPLFCHFNGSPLTVFQFRSVLKKALRFCGLDVARIKSHSLRIGGATDLYQQGHSECYIKAMGRWRSNAYKGYIR